MFFFRLRVVSMFSCRSTAMPSPRDRLVDYGSSDEESSSSTPPAGCLPKAKATLGECSLDSSSSMEEIVEEEVPEVRRPKTPPTPEEHAASSASEEDTKKGEPVHTRGRSPAKAAPPGEKGRSPRSSNPTAASSGKGRARILAPGSCL